MSIEKKGARKVSAREMKSTKRTMERKASGNFMSFQHIEMVCVFMPPKRVS